jgi:hypothetical protein
LRHQFAHLFQTDGNGDERLIRLHNTLFPPERKVREPEPVS